MMSMIRTISKMTATAAIAPIMGAALDASSSSSGALDITN